MNEAFDAFSNDDRDMYPEDLRSDIDSWNELIYNTVDNGGVPGRIFQLPERL